MESVTTAYGAPALAALSDIVAREKADDPLAPLTILVPNNIAGLFVRRHLAHGVTDRTPGISGVFISTLPRLAEQLVAASLYPRGPATATIVAAAWRSTLDESPGIFKAVADHPATIRALTTAHRELRDLSGEALTAIADASPLHASLIDLHRKASNRIAHDWYDETDLLMAAAQLITDEPRATDRWGRIVLYLPQRLSRAEIHFTTTLVAHTEVTLLAGLTSDPRADSAVHDVLRAMGAQPVKHAERPAIATQVIHASDSDDEVRRVVRDVVAAIGPVPAHRIAVLHTGDVPHARLLHEQLTAAGIAFNGRGTRSIAERSISRGLLGMLALTDDMPRAALFRALAEAPARRSDGSTIPLSRWERVSRLAGVVGGSDWDERLDRFIRTQREAIERQTASDTPLRGQVANEERQIQTAEDLGAFVRGLRQRLTTAATMAGWADLGGWALEMFHDLYGEAAELGRLPAEEQYAAAAIERILRGISGLDAFGFAASPERLRDLLLLELEAALPRVGRFGEGVFVGPVSAAIGVGVDLVFVVGLAEDAYPGRAREDALLSAEVRGLSLELRGAGDRIDAQHRHLLAAFAAAPTVIATFPRGDLRRSTERLPSRWLLPTLRALTKRPDLVAIDWELHPAESVIGVRSYASELLSTPSPATEQEWRTMAVSAGQALDDPVTESAGQLIHARASRDFTRFDGNLVDAVSLPDYATSDRRVSPTALETFATCPHSYFVGRLLGVEPLEQPEEIITISPLDIGNLIHGSMDEFIQDRKGSLPGFGAPWTDDDRQRLQEIATASAEDFVSRGATGHPLLWKRELVSCAGDSL